jgi:membrane dipeptidase
MRPAIVDAVAESHPRCCPGDPASRRAFLRSLLGAVTAACAGPTEAGSTRREQDLVAQGADALAHEPIVDLHAHPGFFTRGELPVKPLRQMRAARVDTAFFSVVGDGPIIRRSLLGGAIHNVRAARPGELYGAALVQCERIRRRAEQGALKLILDPSDVDAARRAGVPGALLAFEGGDALEGRPARVQEFHALGMRSIQLVHYTINELGDIQTEPPRYNRLTAAGQEIVGEMNRLGMVVDGAHAPAETLRGILAASKAPIIVSHTGPLAVRTSSRHLSDDLIMEVAARGGVIGIWPWSPPQRGSLHQMISEIDYVRRLVGIEHVGIGTDMDGMAGNTAILTYEDFAPLPAALLAYGFSESDTRKLLGGNLMRVFTAVTSGDV